MDRRKEHAARAVAAGHKLALDPDRLPGLLGHRRDDCELLVLIDSGHAHSEAEFAAGGHELVSVGRDELVLRVDVAAPAACQRAVIQRQRLSLEPELTDVVDAAVEQDRIRQPLLIEQTYRPMFDQPCSGPPLELLTREPLEHDARDPRLLKHQRQHQPRRPGADDAHLSPLHATAHPAA